MNRYFEFKFKNKNYKVKKDKVIFLIECLTNCKSKHLKNYQIIKLFKKFNLLNKDFLKNISKL